MGFMATALVPPLPATEHFVPSATLCVRPSVAAAGVVRDNLSRRAALNPRALARES
jgi:hypothetical protein